MMEPWHYDTSEDLERSLIERLRHFPREPDILVYSVRTLAALLLRAWLKIYHRFKIIGQENLPREGSFVLVANHTSHLDAISILSALPLMKLHRVFPAAAKDFFFESIPRTALATVIVNALPFDRETNVRQSLTLCKQLLQNPGNVLLIFPEGTRSTTGELGEFKPGVGLLLAGIDLPVVPCYLEGAFEAMPKGRIIPHPHLVRLTIGKPRNYSHLKRGKETAQYISQDLKETILQLKDR
jgi:1-acyl-sn-glycerol-3-phosphate acyltransferase